MRKGRSAREGGSWSRSERRATRVSFSRNEDSVGTAGGTVDKPEPHQSPKNLFGRARSRGVAPDARGRGAARGVVDARARGASARRVARRGGSPRRARGVRVARGSARGGVVATRMSRRPRGEKKNACAGGVDASRALSRSPLGSRAVRGGSRGARTASPGSTVTLGINGRLRRGGVGGVLALGADDEAVRAVRARRNPADDGLADDGRLGGHPRGRRLGRGRDAHAGEGGGAGGHGRHRASANDVSRSRRSMRCDLRARARRPPWLESRRATRPGSP